MYGIIIPTTAAGSRSARLFDNYAFMMREDFEFESQKRANSYICIAAIPRI